ncbi:unnamed protein product [Linum trigynum]|uniref:Gnk2-homologous domain-containing protein n=1 Tax=Linum trigynum TaxID=586398 RepID=A0AAV2E369_9ROSI
MRNLLRFSAAIFIIGTYIISGDDKSVATVMAWEFSFPDHHCSDLPIQEWSGLGKARAELLSDLVKLHWQPRYRFKHLTCIRETREKATMWARVDCNVDPSSDYCNKCLIAAKNFLDGNCKYFTGGRVVEIYNTCVMSFADYDVCAS